MSKIGKFTPRYRVPIGDTGYVAVVVECSARTEKDYSRALDASRSADGRLDGMELFRLAVDLVVDHLVGFEDADRNPVPGVDATAEWLEENLTMSAIFELAREVRQVGIPKAKG